MKSKVTKSARKLGIAVIAVLILLMLVGCGKQWTCDKCDKTWRGEAYYGVEYSDTYCAECAAKYWKPFPYKNYVKD